MGKLFEWLKVYYLATLPNDTLRERLHIHVVRPHAHGFYVLAKIWIESNGKKQIDVAYSDLPAKHLSQLLSDLEANWELVIQQVKNALGGAKVTIIKL